MKISPGQILRAIGAIFFITSPLLTHFVLTHGNPKSTSFGVAGSALLLCQGLLISVLIGRRLQSSFRLPAIAAVMACSVSLCVFHLRGGLMLSSGSPHALIYSGLLIGFGLSLLPGREPVVTYFARTIHGSIAPEIEHYTRRVTWAWCWFFSLELLGSAILLMLAPVVWWSTFVNILNLPLLAAMLLGERVTRSFWVANPPHEYLSDFLRMPALLRQRLKNTGAEAL
jgi:uncharacterized membrane protein